MNSDLVRSCKAQCLTMQGDSRYLANFRKEFNALHCFSVGLEHFSSKDKVVSARGDLDHPEDVKGRYEIGGSKMISLL